MALKNLGKWLIDQPDLTSGVNALTAHAALAELGDSITANPEIANLEHDWRHLLLSASILAASDDGRCQSTALRIAQACLLSHSSSELQRDSAGMILDILSNHPALGVAIRKKLIAPELQQRLPPSARLEWTRRSISDSIPFGKRYLGYSDDAEQHSDLKSNSVPI